MTRPLRVAIVGAGPAGIYAGNILNRQVTEAGGEVAIDLFESLPAPYGLIRYGVAPDHPRIKGIVNSLHEMLDAGTIRLIGNVEVGRDVSVDELRERYDAVVFATGALRDAPLDIPGIDLPGSYGAADLVAWYDGHPDVPRDWPLEAEQIAVIGNGNVALDVARVLAKHPKDLLSTDVPANVVAGLEASPVTDVHVFGRRGPTHVKFTPIELRELGEVPDVDVIVYDDDFERAAGDPHADQLLASNNQVKVMTRTLNGWRKPADWQPTASRRLHLHFLHTPVEVLGAARVEGVRFERTRPVGDGSVAGTGEFVDVPVQAVYRAVGYASSPAAGRAVRRARGRHPERRRPGHGCRGRAPSRRVRHRVDQARPRRPHRPHQGRRPRDHHEPARGCRGGRAARTGRRGGARRRRGVRAARGPRHPLHDLGRMAGARRARARARRGVRADDGARRRRARAREGRAPRRAGGDLARRRPGRVVTYVIALPCVDVKDRACIDECPVDCIYEGERSLYIHPDECVDCGACEPVCPVEAIYYEDDLPDVWADYYKANVEFFDDGRLARRRREGRGAQLRPPDRGGAAAAGRARLTAVRLSEPARRRPFGGATRRG